MAFASQESRGKYAVDRSGKVKVTILGSEWGSSKGGLSTINRELGIQLAKSSDVEISFLVPQCSEKDKTEALWHNICIVEATQLVGYEELEWLSFPPDELQIEVVVGHGVKLGRQAQVIRKSHQCKWVQVVHTDPEEMGMFKCYPDPISRGEEKHNDEVKLCEKADFVVGIGPKLAEAFRSYLRYCKNDRTIFDFTPGIFEEFRCVEQVPEEGNHRSVLVFGRGDIKDFELKGFDIAGKAVASPSLVDTHLVFVGAPNGKHEEVAEYFVQCGLPRIRLKVRGYDESRESLKKLFCEVDLVLMPSRTDGFGLTGLEALSAGLPVLVSKNSGFGEALCKVPLCSPFVIDSDKPDVWATAIKEIIRDKNRQCRLEEAENMRLLYDKKYSWTKQSDALRSKIIELARACLQLQIDGVPVTEASAQKGTGTNVNSWELQKVIQAVTVPSNTKEQQVEVNAGSATEHCGDGSIQSTQAVFNQIVQKYLRNVDPSNPEQWNGFVCFLQEVHKLMILRVDSGSLLIIVEIGSEEILEELWQDYQKGHLNKMAQKFLVTEELLEEFGLIEFNLTTFIAEGEYKTCQRYFSGNIASRRNTADNIAIPLCLPNNCHWNAATGEYDRTKEQRRSLYVVELALRKLRTVKGPVCVVSIAGPCRKGKSYILSKSFDQGEVFPLGHFLDPETMGIWMWVVPEKLKDSNGQELTVVLLDSEGIDAVSSDGSDDHCIFTLTILLASVMIYNSAGVPTRNDLDGLDFILKLSQRIQLRSTDHDQRKGTSATQDDANLFHKIFPHFIWLLRDVVLALPKDCSNIKEYFLKRVFQSSSESKGDNADKIAESILNFFSGFDAFKLPPPSSDPEVVLNLNREEVQDDINKSFKRGVQEFKELLRAKLAPKRSYHDGEYVTGEALASLVNIYVAALNTPGVVPSVQSAWETFVHTKCSEAKMAAIQIYEKEMSTQMKDCKLPCDSDDIREMHKKAIEEGLVVFQAETAGVSAKSSEKYLNELMECMENNLVTLQKQNNDLTREECLALLRRLKKENLDPILGLLTGEGGASVSFAEIIGGYSAIEKGFKSQSRGAKDVCAQVFYEFHPELQEEMKKHMAHLQQLKDYDESLAEEKEQRARQEQERIRMEEEFKRLEEERNAKEREMKLLQEKQEEDRKRLEQQFRADMETQRQQMSDMMAANMNELRADRQAILDQNKTLQDTISSMEDAMNSRNEQMQELQQQMIKIANRPPPPPPKGGCLIL